MDIPAVAYTTYTDHYLSLFYIWELILEAEEIHRHKMFPGMSLEHGSEKALKETHHRVEEKEEVCTFNVLNIDLKQPSCYDVKFLYLG